MYDSVQRIEDNGAKRDVFAARVEDFFTSDFLGRPRPFFLGIVLSGRSTKSITHVEKDAIIIFTVIQDICSYITHVRSQDVNRLTIIETGVDYKIMERERYLLVTTRARAAIGEIDARTEQEVEGITSPLQEVLEAHREGRATKDEERELKRIVRLLERVRGNREHGELISPKLSTRRRPVVVEGIPTLWTALTYSLSHGGRFLPDAVETRGEMREHNQVSVTQRTNQGPWDKLIMEQSPKEAGTLLTSVIFFPRATNEGQKPNVEYCVHSKIRRFAGFGPRQVTINSVTAVEPQQS